MLLIFLLFFVTVVSATEKDYKSKLEDPAWQDVIADGGMHIGGAKVKRFIAFNEQQDNVPHQACVLPNGKSGHCRHLRHCIQDEFRSDFIKFMKYICVINNDSVGACCPDDVGGPEGLAGELPATAPKEEQNEAIQKVMRAETRGCGLSTSQQSRELGSRPAYPREWPWMAFVIPEGELQYCGGALITNRHVLTAAHCTRRYKAKELFVRLGEYDYTRSNDSRTYTFKVAEIRQHEEFELPSYKNDIAILKLDRPAVFNTYVWPICLPPLNLELTDEPATVIGWGTLYYKGPRSDVLMEVTVPVWDHDVCVASFTATIFNETICAGGLEGGRDSCKGDSGGPLMYQMPSGRWVSIGVVSWGVKCGEPNHPGIYTRVDKYLDWIAQNVVF